MPIDVLGLKYRLELSKTREREGERRERGEERERRERFH